MRKKARVIAFYLPQYHPTENNNIWWGKGFTEWTNVGKAKPLYKGHYQPKVPADLGYYDLRLPEIREQQAELARGAGVEGFMYWHYWMGNGKRLLNRPIDEVLASGKPDFPFCFGWANHDWKTSTWTTIHNFQKNKMICPVVYSGDQDYIDHFNWCLKALKDPRYIKVDGKPFFLLYYAIALPDAKHFFDLWNKLAQENGFQGMHFVGLGRGSDVYIENQLNLGYDAVASSLIWQAEQKAIGSFRKRWMTHLRRLIDWIPLDKYNYKDIIKYLREDLKVQDNIYPCIIPGWDRSSRSGRKAVIYYGSTPELCKQHVQQMVETVQNKPEEYKIIILRSWNEWGEGNYVEPDERWGHAYLDALHDVLFDK